MFLEISTIAQNVTDIAVTYTAQQISDAANELILRAFLKIIVGVLASVGLAKLGKEMNGIIVAVGGIFGAWAAIDFIKAIAAVITQTMP